MEKKELGRRGFIKSAALSVASVGLVSESILAKSMAEIANYAVGRGMPVKTLGSTGVKIPILQQGTAQQLDPVYDKILHTCYREGVTVIDTALNYGWGASHAAVANFLGQVKNREKLWITSKSGDESPEGMTYNLDKCLQQLKTNYLDLYFMHGINDTRDINKEILKTADKMKRSGKTRFFGFSCHGGNVVNLMNKAAKIGGIDAILFRYNFRKYGDRNLNAAIDACKRAGIGLIAMKTMGAVPKTQEDVVQFRSKNFTLGQAKLKSVWADE